jgi:hypothetical protein
VFEHPLPLLEKLLPPPPLEELDQHCAVLFPRRSASGAGPLGLEGLCRPSEALAHQELAHALQDPVLLGGGLEVALVAQPADGHSSPNLARVQLLGTAPLLLHEYYSKVP